ncbi:uncharacterized protein BKA55DRAFT_552993 [Fusarium redolens]|jgi:hypothetical protein|uniref:Uncharacterized protein n=1 Tax=Fusarium redolens TaxID=48865 RepID=A0A9P9KQJ4_FUSRE|nr:uncharacterized protein BKA55DRAFT_552993 [Fusarium redolens]KAH7266674.1 hypothetical protein BKA55DRAFT_552993 [Fusarium redolens]
MSGEYARKTLPLLAKLSLKLLAGLVVCSMSLTVFPFTQLPLFVNGYTHHTLIRHSRTNNPLKSSMDAGINAYPLILILLV